MDWRPISFYKLAKRAPGQFKHRVFGATPRSKAPTPWRLLKDHSNSQTAACAPASLPLIVGAHSRRRPNKQSMWRQRRYGRSAARQPDFGTAETLIPASRLLIGLSARSFFAIAGSVRPVPRQPAPQSHCSRALRGFFPPCRI